MKRRNFLKILGLAPVAAIAVKAVIPEEKPKFHVFEHQAKYLREMEKHEWPSKTSDLVKTWTDERGVRHIITGKLPVAVETFEIKPAKVKWTWKPGKIQI